METFWRWLMRADARVMLPCALVALLLVSGWWTWRLLRPVRDENTVLPYVPKEKPRPPLGLLAMIQDEDSTKPFSSTRNPFEAPFRWTVPKAPEDPVKPPIDTTGAVPPTTPATTPAVKPVKPPKPPPVNLTYHGMFLRADGTVLALVENSRQPGSAFYPSTGTIGRLVISNVNTQELTVIRPDGVTNTLPVRKPVQYSHELFPN